MSTPTTHCHYCNARCRDNYVFCYPCFQQLPQPLIREIESNYRSRRISRITDDLFSSAVKMAYEYLKLDAAGRNEYVHQKWREGGNGWATEFLQQTGQITGDDDMKMLHDRENLRGER